MKKGIFLVCISIILFGLLGSVGCAGNQQELTALKGKLIIFEQKAAAFEKERDGFKEERDGFERELENSKKKYNDLQGNFNSLEEEYQILECEHQQELTNLKRVHRAELNEAEDRAYDDGWYAAWDAARDYYPRYPSYQPPRYPSYRLFPPPPPRPSHYLPLVEAKILVEKDGYYKFVVVPNNIEIFVDGQPVASHETIYLTRGWHKYWYDSKYQVRITITDP